MRFARPQLGYCTAATTCYRSCQLWWAYWIFESFNWGFAATTGNCLCQAPCFFLCRCLGWASFPEVDEWQVQEEAAEQECCWVAFVVWPDYSGLVSELCPTQFAYCFRQSNWLRSTTSYPMGLSRCWCWLSDFSFAGLFQSFSWRSGSPWDCHWSRCPLHQRHCFLHFVEERWPHYSAIVPRQVQLGYCTAAPTCYRSRQLWWAYWIFHLWFIDCLSLNHLLFVGPI